MSRPYLSLLLGASLLGASIPALADAPMADAHGAPAARPPVSSFFDHPHFDGPKLSPDGRYLAARVSSPGKRTWLSVLRLDAPSVQVVAVFNDADVGYFEWVNNERLVFDATDKEQTYSDERFAPGLYAVNRDGSNLLQLADTGLPDRTTGSHLTTRKLGWNHFLLHQAGHQDNDSTYVYQPIWSANGDIKHMTLQRLNTLTAKASAVQGPGEIFQWLLDQHGEPRIAVGLKDQKTLVYLRVGDGDGAQWRKVAEFDAYTGKGPQAFSPVGFAPDGTLYVAAAPAGRDTMALYRYDLAQGKLGAEPVLELDGYDFNGALITNDDKLLGISYLADVPSVAWIDARYKALQDKVDTLLPGRVNQLSFPRQGDSPWVLVRSHSDVEPVNYLLYHRDSGKLSRVGGSYELIDPARMGRQELVHYRARDGLSIPAWITYPHGSARKQLPLVMLVHGGPYLRGQQWGWNPDAQFLASRGYAVMEPEFRGSTGFGFNHFHAGWKQWGLAMQDDIADGAKWAAAQGIADPKRVCIAGASYGGYAVLMGLIRDPELYRCGIDWVGVTDIKLMYTGDWSFKSDFDRDDRWKRYGMPVLVGDPERDAAQLAATSPLLQAARIKQPLLLAYGTEDHRVPLYHGEKFYAAVKAGNPNVEWITYDKEGHGWRLPAHRYDFWNRVEQFLDRNIGQH